MRSRGGRRQIALTGSPALAWPGASAFVVVAVSGGLAALALPASLHPQTLPADASGEALYRDPAPTATASTAHACPRRSSG